MGQHKFQRGEIWESPSGAQWSVRWVNESGTRVFFDRRGEGHGRTYTNHTERLDSRWKRIWPKPEERGGMLAEKEKENGK